MGSWLTTALIAISTSKASAPLLANRPAAGVTTTADLVNALQALAPAPAPALPTTELNQAIEGLNQAASTLAAASSTSNVPLAAPVPARIALQQREQNTTVHMWPFFQLNVKSPPVGGLLMFLASSGKMDLYVPIMWIENWSFGGSFGSILPLLGP